MSASNWEGHGQAAVATGPPSGGVADEGAGPPLRIVPGVQASSSPEDGESPQPLAVADAALVVRSQSGDRAAFEQLVRRTARLLFSRLYLETGDAHRAEDLVQETFLVAWRSLHQVTDPAGFRSWLFAVAHTVLIDAGRREGRKKRARRRAPGDAADVLAGLPDPRPGPPESAQREEQRRRVLALLRQMPEEYRQPLTLRYLGGADYETIGRQLGLSNGSLRGLLSRGMARLREKMRVMSDE